MHKDAQELYAQAKAAHETLYKLVLSLKTLVPVQDVDELADTAYAMREAGKYADDIRKEINAVGELAERLCCLKYLSDATNLEPIKTEYCTASPDMQTCAKIPTLRKDAAAYEKLMQWLGIDPVLWDRGEIDTEDGLIDTECVRVHWPGFTALLGRLAKAGLPLPDGIDSSAVYHLYKLRIRKTKGVSEA